MSHVTCDMSHVTCDMSNAYVNVTCDMSNAYVNPWDMVNNFCFDVYAQKGVFVIMSHVTCLMSNVYVDPWDMLNKFCFYVYAQMSLFMGENDNVFFFTATPSPVSGPIIELVPG